MSFAGSNSFNWSPPPVPLPKPKSPVTPLGLSRSESTPFVGLLASTTSPSSSSSSKRRGGGLPRSLSIGSASSVSSVKGSRGSPVSPSSPISPRVSNVTPISRGPTGLGISTQPSAEMERGGSPGASPIKEGESSGSRRVNRSEGSSPASRNPPSRIPRMSTGRTPTQARPSTSTTPAHSRPTRQSPSRSSSARSSPVKGSPNRTPTALIRPDPAHTWQGASSSSVRPDDMQDEVLAGDSDVFQTPDGTPRRPSMDISRSSPHSEHRLSSSSVSSLGSNRSRRLSSPAQKPHGPRQRPRSSIISVASAASNGSNWSERNDTISDLHPSASNVPRPPLLIDTTTGGPKVPRRNSSTSTSSSVESAGSPRHRTVPPPISPRGSSKEQLYDPTPPQSPAPQSDYARRASRNVLLGDASGAPPPPRPPLDARRRPSNHVDVSELFGPTAPPGATRRAGMTRIRDDPLMDGHTSPPEAPSTRRSNPNLRLSTPPAASSSRFSLMSVNEGSSPPVPSKNPLRRISQGDLTSDSPRPTSGRSTSGATTPSTPPAYTEEPDGGSTARANRIRRRDSKDSTFAAPPDSPFFSTSRGVPLPVTSLDSPPMTMQSMYSQESLSHESDTTNESHEAISPGVSTTGEYFAQQQEAHLRNETYGWGRKKSGGRGEIPLAARGSRIILTPQSASRKDLPPIQTSPPSSSRLDLPSRDTPISAASTVGSTSTPIATTATTDPGMSALNGYGAPQDDGVKTATRSPSMPLLKTSPPSSPTKASRHLGIAGQQHHLHSNRSATDPSAGLLAVGLQRSPTSPNVRTPSTTPLSKRTHLIREIATTERAYANDLALIRDAYLSRYRPLSTASSKSIGELSSERSSTYTESGTMEARRLSAHSLNSNAIGAPTPSTPLPSTPLPKSPSDSLNPGGYFGIGATPSGSTINLQTPSTTPGAATSPRTNMKGVPNPSTPPGKPLSSADVRAVFLNLEQLASAAEEMALEFEKAMGGDGANSQQSAEDAKEAREGEKGDDRIGEVFMQLIPKYRQLYTFYCARQSSASARLLELHSDAGHAAYLKQCWNKVRPHTHAWNLDSMLIKPVQRITKYPLLFDDLLACTTPVHPDYFAIRNAAELARNVAMEIDEAKRRKDVVAGIIKKVPVVLNPRELKPLRPSKVKPKGLKLFSKNKANTSSISLASRASSTRTLVEDLPPSITPTSLSDYRELIARLEEVDMCVRRVGKDIVIWTANAKEVIVAQQTMIHTWARVVQLDASDPADKRLAAFRKVLDGIVAEHWANLNDDVKDSIMPALGRLLDSMSNPRKVISRRDAKAPEYARYQAARDARRPIEPILLDSAREFVALHAQLVEELPAFLEGFIKIFDITLVAFSRAQAAYHEGTRNGLDKFAQNWIGGISPRPPSSHIIVLDDETDGGPPAEDLRSGAGIIRAWHDAWTPYDEAMRHFQTTARARTTTTRSIYSASSRPASQAGSPGGRPNLRHANSATSQRGLREPLAVPTAPNEKRPRAVSMLTEPAPTPTTVPVSPTATSNFKLVKTTSSPNKTPPPPLAYQTPPSPKTTERPLLSPHGRNKSDDRLSFGLPTVSPSVSEILNPDFSGPPGSRPTDANAVAHAHAQTYAGRASNHLGNVGLGLGEFGVKNDLMSSVEPADTTVRRKSKPSSIYLQRESDSSLPQNGRSDPPVSADMVTASSSASIGSAGGLGSPMPLQDSTHRRRRTSSRASGDLRRSPRLGASSKEERYLSREERRASREERRSSRDERRLREEYDAAEGWRNEAVLYQCAAVAEFDPAQYGDRRYRKLRFLPVRTGDLIDVFYEVGRIDELPSFPYTDIGVENDGVLVGRAENQDIGLVICSFLEPLV